MRQLEYLAALATERHFARAAERCGVSQPTLSTALRQLEDDLGVPIVERGNRFVGFTPDGEIVLRWARQMLADQQQLRFELEAARGELKGRLHVGVIPSTNAVVPRVTASFAMLHPHVAIDESETTSDEVLRKLAAFELDAGITYTDNEPLDHVRALPMYEERYVAVIPESSPLSQREAVTWREVAALPMCLLHGDMQNRRIYDKAFAAAGGAPNVRIEVSSMMASLAYVQPGGLATIVPRTLLPWVTALPGMRAVGLVEPEVSKAVGLVVSERSPVPGLVEAFWRHVERSFPEDGAV